MILYIHNSSKSLPKSYDKKTERHLTVMHVKYGHHRGLVPDKIIRVAIYDFPLEGYYDFMHEIGILRSYKNAEIIFQDSFEPKIGK